MSPFERTLSWVVGVVALCVACQRRDSGAHEHHEHSHGDHDHDEQSGPEPIGITRWTDRYELFVEFPAPKPGAKLAYHAHVTRLSDFQPVPEGRFTVRYRRGGQVVTETSVDRVRRAGIFTLEGAAPAAGKYSLEITYELAGQSDTFDCGTIEVSPEPNAPTEEEAGAISFSKEAQWKIPFATGSAEARELRGLLEFPATVESAASDQLTLGAPTSGRFFHDRRAALAVGRQVKKGEVLGSIAPNVEGEDFTKLEASVDEARLQEEQLRREIERVTPLVSQGLLPERRLIELENDLSVQRAKLGSAERRVGRVVAPGGAGGLPIRATMSGLVREVLVPNGEPVEAGAVLLRLGGTDHVWLRSRFVARRPSELADAEPAFVRLSDGRRIDLKGRGKFMSAQPIVDPTTRLATWVIDVAPGSTGGAEVDLPPGAALVVTVKAGAARQALAVPRGAVVEISTRPYVFVQQEGESFSKRRVELGASDGDWVEIRSGVKAGERVVTEGGFDVHVASLGGAVESHRH
jgi:RND family efflux transporter MFP subunit